MTSIPFSVSIPKEKAETMMAALQYHDVIHTMELQSDLKHYYFQFTVGPMTLFEVGGTYHEYLRISSKNNQAPKK